MANLSRKSGKLFLLFSAATLLLISCTDSVAPTYKGRQVKILATASILELEEAFYRHRYDIDHLNSGIPALIFETLPKELAEVRPAARKKSLFFQALLPMVLIANQTIAEERKELLAVMAQLSKEQTLTDKQRHLLSTLQQRYAVKGDPTTPRVLAELQLRIDQVPPELAMAQAANESAWGTSRFSQLGNNLFGEWTFIPGTGIIPEGRPAGATYEVRRFASLYDSIHSYLRNLNTHSAYADFRKLRSAARKRGETPRGVELANGLLHYSTRREAYVLDLQNLIRHNNLQRFAEVNLRQG